MKRANLAMFAILGFTVCGIAFFSVNPNKTEAGSKVVSLKVSSDRTNYKLGEIVEIETFIKNNSSNSIEVGGDSKSWAVIKIAFGDDRDYKMYVGPSNGFT